MLEKIVLINAQRMEIFSHYLKNSDKMSLTPEILDFLQKEATIGARELALALHPIKKEEK